ncbi:uncharacterized protein (TIGR03083 family) [Herbihabitans rhizosphaerae]|uniref:Uncharacterized protein (TIGR03083 family) n=1 Tax=Herbihabitans rhizosphaerae TaxID=1872711 RepID=A0A4Q7L478_9PSEU|nr:maleylpyruvate isomerase family mycothiol-dependent enzyme [Herbihabitans rhizosphaerae]RZS44429.1 uncharacterized protein (TIGR03083 family) [Herbihabitans rhizosphaerae]
MSNSDVYDAARRRITELVTHDWADIDADVPACPGWTVRDVIAHLAGGLADFAARRFDGVETGEWGERQVRDRREQSIEDSLTEWNNNRARAGALFDSPMGPVLISEIVQHEHDIRGALNRSGARDGTAVRAALTRPLQELDKKIKTAELPALKIILGHGERVVGDGEPVGTLTVSSFEMLRAIGGRRSRKQLSELNWDVDPEQWLDVLPLFGKRADDLAE